MAEALSPRARGWSQGSPLPEQPRPWLFKASMHEGEASWEHLAHPDKRGGKRLAPAPHPCPQLPSAGTFALSHICGHPISLLGLTLSSLGHRRSWP